MNKKPNFLTSVKGFLEGFNQAMNYKATAQIAYEIKEMEHSFALMLYGNFVGLPSPPMPIALELLPVMQGDLEKILTRASQTGNGLSELASVMGEP
jgi:hypothetical protein